MSSNLYPIPSIKIPTNFVPKTPADYQQLQLLYQLQNGTMPSLNILILNQVINFPFLSIETKLGIYHFLTSLPFVPSIHLSPGWFAIVGLMFPILMWGFLALFIVLIVLLIRQGPGMIAYILGKFNKVVEEKAFLELTFPSSATKSAYATEQLYKLLNTRAKKQSWFQGLIRHKKIYSLEIVSSRDTGIQFMLIVPKKEAEIIHHTLISFLPGLKVREVEDYLIGLDGKIEGSCWGVVELKQGRDFVLPLQDQKVLEEHDPISFLIGTMTKLDPGELIAFQIVTTPIIHSVQSGIESRLRKIRLTITKGEPLTPLLQPIILGGLESFWPVKIIVLLFKAVFLLIKFLLFVTATAVVEFIHQDSRGVTFFGGPKINIHASPDPFERELHEIVRNKVSQHLFETSIRILIASENEMEFESRADAITSSLGQFSTSYQSLISSSSILPSSFIQNRRLKNFKQRALSSGFGSSTNPILSASEMADLYHFPNTDLTKVEGLVKHKSKNLPAPLSIKKSTAKFDVLIGINQYGGEIVPIGLTKEQRQKHTYVVGKTGTGKTTMLKNMIYQDMVNGKGLAVLDPHGDLIKELLSLIPKERIKDVIYLDPSDRDFPIGINILSPGIKFANKDDEQEWITSSVISVFLKLTPKEYWGHRLEHILRNATLTALQTPSPTLLTIQRLLTDKSYQKKVSSTLTDPVLKQFWEKEFKLFGSMQQAAAISPLTNRLGKFITTKMSRHILLQGKSTISIQKIMDEGKILLVNLSKGDLGEDVSFFFGTILTSFIQMAAYQRTKIPESQRRDFFLYIDEFQNFATPTFSELMSEGRKFHISLIPSHQNIAQIEDVNLIKTIVGNANTIICMNASPDDEVFILPFMEPEVEKGEIVNLASYQFFIKAHNEYSEDAFSGETIKLDVEEDQKIKDTVIANTRKHYGLPRQEVEEYVEALFAGNDVNMDKTTTKRTKKLAV